MAARSGETHAASARFPVSGSTDGGDREGGREETNAPPTGGEDQAADAFRRPPRETVKFMCILLRRRAERSRRPAKSAALYALVLVLQQSPFRQQHFA